MLCSIQRVVFIRNKAIMKIAGVPLVLLVVVGFCLADQNIKVTEKEGVPFVEPARSNPLPFFQYTNVPQPGVFGWAYRRGSPIAHTRSQFLNQNGDIFRSTVSTKNT
jgi:hypothetical protein